MSSIVVGVLILTVIQNGMQMMQMDAFAQNIVKGIVLIIAIWLDAAQTRRVIRQAKVVQEAPPENMDEPVAFDPDKGAG